MKKMSTSSFGKDFQILEKGSIYYRELKGQLNRLQALLDSARDTNDAEYAWSIVDYLYDNNVLTNCDKVLDYVASTKGINASTEVDEAWDSAFDPFNGKTYRVHGGYHDTRYTDSPKLAIRYWYQMQAKHPEDVAIMCKTREQAVELCTAATEDYIYALDEKYGKGPHPDGYREKGCPYMPQYLVDEAAKEVANGQKYFYENDFGDSVHPFGVG